MKIEKEGSTEFEVVTSINRLDYSLTLQGNQRRYLRKKSLSKPSLPQKQLPAEKQNNFQTNIKMYKTIIKAVSPTLLLSY